LSGMRITKITRRPEVAALFLDLIQAYLTVILKLMLQKVFEPAFKFQVVL
jgi:hypothetical protein